MTEARDAEGPPNLARKGMITDIALLRIFAEFSEFDEVAEEETRRELHERVTELNAIPWTETVELEQA